MKRAKITAALLIIWVFAGGISTYAQTSSSQGTGIVRGIVADESGARISWAKVVFAGPTERRETKVNEAGEYSIELPTGSYAIKISADHFCPTPSRLIEVESGKVTTLDCELKPWRTHTGCRGEHDPDAMFERIDEKTAKTFRINIWFLNSETTKDWYEYRKANVEQSLLKLEFDGVVVLADKKISLHKFAHRIKAEGNVIITMGGKTIRAKYSEFDYTKKNPITFLKN